MNRKYSVLVLGDEGERKVEIKTNKDMEKFAEASGYEAERILRYNRRTENIIIGMIIGLFMVAIGFILLGAFYWNLPKIAAGGTIAGIGISITWPIRQLIRLRESNISIQFFSIILPKLQPEEAVDYLKTICSTT